MFRKRRLIYFSFIIFFLFICVLRYLLLTLTKSEHEILYTNSIIEEQIKNELHLLPAKYKHRSPVIDNSSDIFINNLYRTPGYVKDLTQLWKEVNSWSRKNQFVDVHSPNLSNILFALKHAHILSADIDRRGTQLKLMLTLEGNQLAVFKPKWYDKNKIIQGSVYAGKDRYGSEILGFYLSVLLGKSLVPMSVERNISLKQEILPFGSKLLRDTSFEQNGKSCVYGKCYYCSKEDPLCVNDDATIPGALILNMNVTLKSNRSPWQRTYEEGKLAVWQVNPHYCREVSQKLSKHRLYDLVELAIFDFLIQNGDRHHYEVFNDEVVFIDNGKGLGNPFNTVLDILAPLYQCCMIRKSTWERLKMLSGGYLTEKLLLMPDIGNFVTMEHLQAIEERLLLVYATVELCKKKRK